MIPSFNILNDQLSWNRQLIYHFYIGVLITLLYVFIGPVLNEKGYPGFATLLLAEAVILIPIGLLHLALKENRLNGDWRLKFSVPFRKKLTLTEYLKWSLAGIGLCFLIYIPLYPVGLFLRKQVFYWLPEWYFNPAFGTMDNTLIAKVFLVGILLDGVLAPVVEELFFRGYLLPRMAYLKKWAPIINGSLFGLYHFWQPHNLVAIIGVGIILSYIVWRKENVLLGIIIHCTINILGAVFGYLAATGGVIIDR